MASPSNLSVWREWREAGGYITAVREWSVQYEKYILMLSRCHSMCLNYGTWTLLTCSIPLEEKIRGYKADCRMFLQQYSLLFHIGRAERKGLTMKVGVSREPPCDLGCLTTS